MIRFCRVELRTTDAGSARAFYAAVLGHDRSFIGPLHERALARGAPPHWLGTLGVEDAGRAAKAFMDRGATRLGPDLPTRDGGQAVVLRDPGGALLAIATRPKDDTDTGVAWHVLNAKSALQTTTSYLEQFGWEPTLRIDLGAQGVFQQFAWHAGGESVGAIGDIAGRPGVHPHWLFFFEVDALDPAIAAVRAAGGSVIELTTLPSGQRVSVCHDPQGAEFALWDRALH
jgi:hypothetical protein